MPVPRFFPCRICGTYFDRAHQTGAPRTLCSEACRVASLRAWTITRARRLLASLETPGEGEAPHA
jgi:endogenous inhibitor of DNA gyrase (YacG/DUF329 family)